MHPEAADRRVCTIPRGRDEAPDHPRPCRCIFEPQGRPPLLQFFGRQKECWVGRHQGGFHLFEPSQLRFDMFGRKAHRALNDDALKG